MFLDLTSEQERIIGIAQELAKEFAPRAEQHDREGSFPFENIARLKEVGYTTMTTPKEYGGWGASPLTFVLAQEQLAPGAQPLHLLSTCTAIRSDSIRRS